MFSVIFYSCMLSYVDLKPIFATFLAIITSFMSGYLADRYDAKNILIVSIICFIVPTLLQPVCAEYAGHTVNLALRAIMGLGMASLCHKILSQKRRLNSIHMINVNQKYSKHLSLTRTGRGCIKCERVDRKMVSDIGKRHRSEF
jgi:hypothetical protein